MFKHLILMVLCCLISGCTHTNNVFPGETIPLYLETHKSAVKANPPCYEEFLSIYAEEYKLNYNDCSNMSSKYARILREHGYEADLLIIFNDDSSHCVVIVTEEDGTFSYYDPTNNEWGETDVLSSEWIGVFIVPFEERFKRGHNGFKERNIK